MDLTPLMKPRSVAVVGASQRVNRATRVITNLQKFGYAGRVFPINAKYTEVLGLPCYPDLASLPEPADVVVVAIPAPDVPAVLTDAAARGVRGAVVLSSGFGEAGPSGRARQEALERLAAERGLLICGPNCYGVFNVALGSATFSADFTETPARRRRGARLAERRVQPRDRRAPDAAARRRALVHRVVRQPGRCGRRGLRRVPRGRRGHAGDRRVRGGIPAPGKAARHRGAGAGTEEADRGPEGRPLGERAPGDARPHGVARGHAGDHRGAPAAARHRAGDEPERDARHGDAAGRRAARDAPALAHGGGERARRRVWSRGRCRGSRGGRAAAALVRDRRGDRELHAGLREPAQPRSTAPAPCTRTRRSSRASWTAC